MTPEADRKCEWCEVRNDEVIRRLDHGAYQYVQEVYEPSTLCWLPATTLPWSRLKFHGLTRIVLTVAHLDRNSKNNARENLAALCQRCHLNHDIRQHLANRKYGRHHAKDHQLKLTI